MPRYSEPVATRMPSDYDQLIAKLRKIEQLFARPGTDGERQAARHASDRIRARLEPLEPPSRPSKSASRWRTPGRGRCSSLSSGVTGCGRTGIGGSVTERDGARHKVVPRRDVVARILLELQAALVERFWEAVRRAR